MLAHRCQSKKVKIKKKKKKNEIKNENKKIEKMKKNIIQTKKTPQNYHGL